MTWIGASTSYYRFLETVYRTLGLRASALRLSNEELDGICFARVTLRTLVPGSRQWRQARAAIVNATAIYTKNEFLELALIFFLGGDRALRKTVVGLHTPLALQSDARGTWAFVHNALYRSFVYRYWLYRAKNIHGVSGAARHDLAFLFSQERVQDIERKLAIIPNGISVKHNSAIERDRSGYAVVGRLSEQKGFDRLPKVLCNERQRRLWIAGDGDQRTCLESQMLSARFLGTIPRSEVHDLLQSKGIMLMPSRWENLPLTLIEAMSCGCIPVVSKLPHLVDALPPTLKWLSVDFDDATSVEVLLKRLELLSPSEDEELRTVLRCHAISSFDLDTQQARLESLLLSVRCV